MENKVTGEITVLSGKEYRILIAQTSASIMAGLFSDGERSPTEECAESYKTKCVLEVVAMAKAILHECGVETNE